ncbi:MAG: ABC transporter ATP-binding protein [Anaerolineae bacterium]|nr:ABC transporter ATP-binding protein [Anaerolineae bacterium]MCO5197984.1 ABC transporter ATP-binding protein [Anaerolineae bacterium]
MSVLEARNLSHRFGRNEVLQRTDITLNAGSITMLVGQNGSGKTTLLRCLGGLLRPTTGNVAIDGYDLYADEREAKRRLALVSDVPHFYLELNAWEHLRFIALAHGIDEDVFEEDAGLLLDEFGLWASRYQFPHKFSRGMRLKLGLITALIRPISVLLLDEPSSALDPDSVDLLLDKLIDLRANGAAVLFTSHSPDLAAALDATTWQMQDGILATAD